MRKAYAAGGMIVRNATRGGGSGNSKGSSGNNKNVEEPSNNSGNANASGGGSNGNQGSPSPQESSPVVVTKTDPALLGAIKNGRIRGRNQHQGNPQPQHRNPHQLPPDVMSLTAKNYRLAKELSELRVRHREECKKQTRLAMENMNLSSKYRDAIQQVILLKKEVAYYQRRSESLAKNGIRAMPSPDTAADASPVSLSSVPSPAAPTAATASSPAEPPSSPPSSSPSALVTPRKPNGLADVVAEISRMDRILADHAAKSEGKPLPHQKDASMDTPGVTFLKIAATESLTPSSTASDDQGSPEGTESPTSSSSDRLDEAADEFDVEIDDLGTPALSDNPVDSSKETKEEEWAPRRIRSKSPDHQTYFPQTASPKFRFNEEYPGDITASVRTGKSQRLSIGRLDEFKEDEEPSPALKQPHLSSSNAARRLPPSASSPSLSQSSIDAFEASFNIDFPDSFSPRDGSPERPPREETYNPFSYSPATYDWSRPSASYSSMYVSPSDPPGRDRTSPPKKKPPTRRSSTPGDPSNGLLPRFNRMTVNDKSSPPDAELPSSSSFASASTSSRTPLAGSGAFLLHTPPPPSPLSTDNSPPVSAGSAALSTPSPSSVATPPPLAVNYVPSSAMLEEMDPQQQPHQQVHEQPKRPEKTGFEAARARREKVLQPRASHAEASAAQALRASPPPAPAPSSSSPPLSDEKRLVKGLDPRSREAILLSARERLSTSALTAAAAASSSSYASPPPQQRSKSLSSAEVAATSIVAASAAAVPASAVAENHPNRAAAVLWGGVRRGGSYEDDDGDIPLRSSLSKPSEASTRIVPTATTAPPSSLLLEYPSSSSSSLRRVTPKPRHLWGEATSSEVSAVREED